MQVKNRMKVPNWLRFEYMTALQKATFIAGFLMLLAIMFVAGMYFMYTRCQGAIGF